jgi:hypothetical protein
MATHPDATIRYIKSDMTLHIHSDASHLSEPRARSRAGGHHFLSSRPADPNRMPQPTDTMPPNNGPIYTPCNIMKHVLASAAESELGALFDNGKAAVSERTTLEEMGHPQPPTPMQTDNSTAAGIANKTVKQRRSKAIDMRFYWLIDRSDQKQFKIHWRKGADNNADYYTKHHPVKHHRTMRPTILHVPQAHHVLALRQTAILHLLPRDLPLAARVC